MEQQKNERANTAVAKKVRMLRAAKNVSREEFSRYMGANSYSVSYWEAGANVPSTEQMGKIDAEFAEVLKELYESEGGQDVSHEHYLSCLKHVTKLSETHLKDLDLCIKNLLKIRCSSPFFLGSASL